MRAPLELFATRGRGVFTRPGLSFGLRAIAGADGRGASHPPGCTGNRQVGGLLRAPRRSEAGACCRVPGRTRVLPTSSSSSLKRFQSTVQANFSFDLEERDLNKIAGRFILFLAVSAFLLCSNALAQETVNYASVGGRVTDASGAAVQGARVVGRQVETNIASTQSTDRDGRFRFPYLNVGPYEIKVHHQGFEEVTRRVTLNVGAAFELPFSLVIGYHGDECHGQRGSHRA